MSKNRKAILQVLSGDQPYRSPVWLMRQAGRYLPEYRELRKQAGSFLDLCLTPKWASEVTLQPIRRFGFDAAILFADILLIPHALGQKLEFQEGEGPVLQKIEDEKSISKLKYEAGTLNPVYETLQLVKNQLPDETALIGFCGAPWTVACYMIDGNSRTGFAETKKWAAERPESVQKLIDILVDASETYLSSQIDAGAEVLQLFDSWAGLLNQKDFQRFVIEPTKKLVARIKRKYPHVPVIGFPREAGKNYHAYIRETGVDAVSIDQHVELSYASRELQSEKPLQGNLDPELLVKGGAGMQKALELLLKTMGPKHIVNLGHGILQQTPVEHVGEMLNIVRKYNWAA